jgi:hypothetical protein
VNGPPFDLVRHLQAGQIAMSIAPTVHSAQELVETYIRAKDENRPYLMERAFAENARLVTVVNSGTITFPPIVNGRQSISDVLVRRFAQTFENVHTFCLAPPPRNDTVDFSCNWLVGMSEKDNRMVRIGCGRYNWSFSPQGPRLVERLKITIDLMRSLDPACLASVMPWISRLPYPWCTAQDALRDAPGIDELQPVWQYLRDSPDDT